MSLDIRHGDCREVMAGMDAESVDAIVCDPPYGLSFMGKGWDHGVPGVEFWTEAFRVAKPGAHLLAFGGTRTYHRLACAIEDAGWEIRDCVMWVYGSGFPKSHNVANAIDKSLGFPSRGRAIPTASTHLPSGKYATEPLTSNRVEAYEARTPEGQPWQGWGTALKPAWEPVIVARKPLVGTVAENVLRHGTGAINVDGCRVNAGEQPKACKAPGWDSVNKANAAAGYRPGEYQQGAAEYQPSTQGRWPANVIHDGSDEVVGLFPANVKGGTWNRTAGARHFNNDGEPTGYETSGSDSTTGSAARFFYCAKASKADRDEGCEWISGRFSPTMGNGIGGKEHDPETATPKRNHHPTVKPTALMRYLCRLVTPPGGLVLDPFCGSGSTGKAAVLEGFRFIGIEREAEYVEIAKARIAAAVPSGTLF